MKRHTVHTKHPRYRVPNYPRGQGEGTQVPVSSQSVSSGSYYQNQYTQLDSDFRKPERLEDVPDEAWRLGYLSLKSGRPNALSYIDVTYHDDPIVDGYRRFQLRTLMNKDIITEMKMIPTSEYFNYASQSRPQYTSASTERRRVVEATAQKYAERMRAGEKAPLPYVDFVFKTQEGRHRARALEILGVRSMPIMIIRKAKPSEQSPPPYFVGKDEDGRTTWTPNPAHEQWKRDVGLLK